MIFLCLCLLLVMFVMVFGLVYVGFGWCGFDGFKEIVSLMLLSIVMFDFNVNVGDVLVILLIILFSFVNSVVSCYYFNLLIGVINFMGGQFGGVVIIFLMGIVGIGYRILYFDLGYILLFWNYDLIGFGIYIMLVGFVL